MDLKGAGEWGTIQNEENTLEDKSKTNHLVFTGNCSLDAQFEQLSQTSCARRQCSSRALLDLEVEVIPGHTGRPELQLDPSEGWEENVI